MTLSPMARRAVRVLARHVEEERLAAVVARDHLAASASFSTPYYRTRIFSTPIIPY